MLDKIEGFFDATDGKNILDDDLYKFCKEHHMETETALLIQIIRELKRIK